MKKQKVLCAAMASAMALSLAVPAFAANETTITATYSEPVIEVSVPTTATAIINPYGLPCKFYYDSGTGKWGTKAPTDADALDSTVFAYSSTGAVATQPMILANYGETALKVSAAATATVKTGSDMKVVTTTVNPDATGTSAVKNANIKVEAIDAGDLSTMWAEATDTTKAGLDYTLLKDAWAGLSWTGEGVKSVTANATTGAAELGTILGKDTAENGSGLPQDGSFLAVRLNGSVVKKPKTDWTSKDGVTVTIAYSFEVVSAPAEEEEEETN